MTRFLHKAGLVTVRVLIALALVTFAAGAPGKGAHAAMHVPALSQIGVSFLHDGPHTGMAHHDHGVHVSPAIGSHEPAPKLPAPKLPAPKLVDMSCCDTAFCHAVVLAIAVILLPDGRPGLGDADLGDHARPAIPLPLLRPPKRV